MAKEVMFTGDNFARKVQEAYKKHCAPMAKEWDTDLVFSLCHGKVDLIPREMDFDKLYIFVQLLPALTEGVGRDHIDYYRINGEKLVFPVKDNTPQSCPQGDTLKYEELPEGAHLITDDEDTPVAVIYDGAIYFLSDFVHSRSKKELDISIKVFDFVINNAVNQTDMLRHLKAGVIEKSRKALEQALKKQYTQRLEKERIQLKATQDTAKKYQQGIIDCTRKVISSEKVVEALQGNLTDIPSALDKTWEEIQKMANGDLYEDISFTKTSLKARTKSIAIEHADKKYVMGRFEVILGFNGSTSIKALEKPERAHHDHPHISNGNPCWGNFAGEIPKRIGYGEYDVALNLIHTFLGHFDSGSPYESIEHWPVVEEKRTEVNQ